MDFNDKRYVRLREGKAKFERALVFNFLQSIFRRVFRRRLPRLWNFDQIRQRLHLTSRHQIPGVQQVDISKIMGSVGRADDFGPTFLPREGHLRDRWSTVYAAAVGTQELPPIELYQVGDVYFVVDGNHRVSIARLLGKASIDAQVTVWDSPVEMTPEMRLRTLEMLAAQVDECCSDDTDSVASIRPDDKESRDTPGENHPFEQSS